MKIIPKREGQKLNGIMPSAFALAFLLLAVPLASTYLIEAAMFFGGDPIVESVDKNEILIGPHPFYESSGDGPDAKCDSVPLVYDGTNCTASLSHFGNLYQLSTHEGSWYQALTGCAEGSGFGSAFSSQGGAPDCGDSDYRITQNITHRLAPDVIFPVIAVNISANYMQTCDWTRMGDSKVDYTITMSHYKRDPIFAGTSVWTYGYIDDTIEMADTYEFNNTWIKNFDPTIGLCQTQHSINVAHQMDFIEVDILSQMLEDHYADGEESFGIFLTIEFDNLRTDEGRLWSDVGYHNPFHGDNDTIIRYQLDLVTYDIDPINTFLRFGVFAMGAGFWLIALASTPYWDPFIAKVKKE